MNEHLAMLTARKFEWLIIALVGVGAAGVPFVHAGEMTIASPDHLAPLITKLTQAYVSSGSAAWDVAPSEKFGPLIKLMDGTVQIAVLDRSATDEERDAVRRRKGRALVGYPFAMSAVVVVVRPDNPLQGMTLDQVGGVFSRRLAVWQALGIDPEGTALRRVGPEYEFDPNRPVPIELYLPGDPFGTAGVVQSRLLKGGRLPPARRFDSKSDLLTALALDANGIGVTHPDTPASVRVLAVRPAEDAPAVLPTEESVRSRDYPPAHYVYLYALGPSEAEVRSFVAFVLGPEGQRVVDEAGAWPLPMPGAKALD